MSNFSSSCYGKGNIDAEILILIFSIVLSAASLMISNIFISTFVAFSNLFFVVFYIYFRYLTKNKIFLSLAFPAFLILIIQSIIYPSYIFLTKNFRFYLFSNTTPNLVPALILWTFAIFGFGLGISLREKRCFRIEKGRRISLFSDSLDFRDDSLKSLVLYTIPIMIVSLFATYLEFRSYGIDAINQTYNLGIFSADSIRRSRGLGPLRLFETWSYVAVAYVGWNAFYSTKFKRTKIFIGVLYSIGGSMLPLLNARRGPILYHLGILSLPFLLNVIKRNRRIRFLVPLLLVLMIFVDTFTSELRGIYYRSNKVDISYALDKTFSENYAPLSFDHLELSSALIEQIQNNEFKPLMGSTFLAAILNWVPRKIWPNKLWTGGTYFSIAMGSSYYFDDSGISSGITTGIIIEALLNIGMYSYILLPLLMIGLGYVLSGINLELFEKGNLVYMAAFSIYYWISIDLFFNDLGGLVNKFIMNTAGLIFLYVLSMVNRRLFLSDDHNRFSNQRFHNEYLHGNKS